MQQLHIIPIINYTKTENHKATTVSALESYNFLLYSGVKSYTAGNNKNIPIRNSKTYISFKTRFKHPYFF